MEHLKGSQMKREIKARLAKNPQASPEEDLEESDANNDRQNNPQLVSDN